MTIMTIMTIVKIIDKVINVHNKKTTTTKTILWLVTFETLITILTIENLNSDKHCYLTINCDTGQHLQFLRCFTEISLVWVKYEFIFSFSSFTSSFFLSASSSSLTLLFSSSLSSCSFVIILICSFWTKSHWSWLNLGLFFVLVISSCHWLTSATSHKKIHLASKIYPKTYIFGKLNCT